MSHGRAGWNAVTTSDPASAANYGQHIAPRPQRYQRAHETIQITQALWGSWQQDAWVKDTTTGRFADPAKIQPINLQGEHVASRGPLPIPPSEQGQPVIFSAGGGGNGLELAGRYASGVIGAVFTIEDARNQREALREAARRAGRNPDEVKFFAGVMPAIATTKRAALDRRVALGEIGRPGPCPVPRIHAGPDPGRQPTRRTTDARPTGRSPRQPVRSPLRQRPGGRPRRVDDPRHARARSHRLPPHPGRSCFNDSGPHAGMVRSAVPATVSGYPSTSTRTESTPSSTRSSPCCRNAASSTTTTKAPPSGTISAPTRSTDSTPGSASPPNNMPPHTTNEPRNDDDHHQSQH